MPKIVCVMLSCNIPLTSWIYRGSRTCTFFMKEQSSRLVPSAPNSYFVFHVTNLMRWSNCTTSFHEKKPHAFTAGNIFFVAATWSFICCFYFLMAYSLLHTWCLKICKNNMWSLTWKNWVGTPVHRITVSR